MTIYFEAPRLRFRALTRCCILLFLSVSSFSQESKVTTPGPVQLDQMRGDFRDPPADSRVMMRWWWFGPAVSKPELEREIVAMRDAGIGGFEVQPVYPMTLDDPEHGIRNFPYLSSDFLDALHFVSQAARRYEMRFDLTLGSGWPYGGPNTAVTQASGALRVVKTAALRGTASFPFPDIGVGEQLLAAFLVRPDPVTKNWKDIHSLPIGNISGGRFALPAALADSRSVIFFIASRTGMMVKRPAVGAEGFVLDHLDYSAVENHLKTVANPMIDELADAPPYAVFSDSLEDYGADWTPDLPEEFQRRRGYDLISHLPALVQDVGPETYDIRYDWGRTLTELLEQNYLRQIRTWAQEHHTRFRAQVYGPPGAILSGNEFVDLPEGEGVNWRGFSPIRWAASANHFYGNHVTSSESFTWIHSPAFRATPLDLKAEADVDFLEGASQLIGHGWPYSPPSATYPGWSFYAAGALNDHNPWWIVMPEVTKYMQRVSYVLRQGVPVNDVALFLPTEDAWAYATPGPRVSNDMIESISDIIGGLLKKSVTSQIIDAGLGMDYIDSRMIDANDLSHPILILPGITRIPLQTYRKLEAFANGGGVVIATRSLPSRAPGLLNAAKNSEQVRDISRRLFQSPEARGHFLPNESLLGALLGRLRTADLTLSTPSEAIGFVHRRIGSDADVYFVANTTNETVKRRFTFRTAARRMEMWDPMSGNETPMGDGTTIDLALEPYQSEIIFCSSGSADHGQEAAHSDALSLHPPKPLDIGNDWRVTFPSLQYSIDMHSLHSWTEDKATRFYSGQTLYEKDVDIPPAYMEQGLALFLDFGQGTRIPRNKQSDGMCAWLESPVREAALVYVNGTLAGSVWHPPYRLEIEKLLKPGRNHIKLIVANLAINALAGRTPPDYNLLNKRYGERFSPQDMQGLRPLLSGVLGTIRLIATSAPQSTSMKEANE
jgi:hypothetical protein